MSNSRALQEKVIKGSIVVLVFTSVGSIFAYLIRVLFSRTLTVENYGLFYATLSLFALTAIYIDLGFGYAIEYLLPKYIKSKDYAKAWNTFVHGLSVPFVMSIVVSILLIILAPFLANNYFKVAGSENLIYIFSIYLIASTIQNGLSRVYIGLQKEKYYSSISILNWLLILSFSVLFFLFNSPYILFYVIAWTSAYVVTTIIFIFLLYKNHSFLTGNKIIWENKILKTLWSYALPSFLGSMIYSLVILTDTFFLTLFRGVREAGIYNVIYPVASISIMLLNPLNNLILPLVSHLMEGEKDKLIYLVNKILEIIPFVGLYFALFIIMFPSSTVSIIFGIKWTGLVEAPLMIIALGTVCLLLSIFLGTILIGTGKIRERLRLLTFIGGFYIIFNALLIWQLGIYGVVITNTSLGLLLCILFLRTIREVVIFKVPYRFYVKLLVFSSFLYLLIRAIRINPHSWIEFVLFGILYTIIFILFGFVLKIYDKKLLTLIIPKK